MTTLIGLQHQNIPISSEHWLQILSPYIYGSMLVDQLNRQNESYFAIFSHKGSTNPPHDTAINLNLFANDKFTVRLELLPAESGAKKLNVAIQERGRPSSIAYYTKYAWGLENPRPLSGADMYKQVRWEKGQDKVHSLSILPDSGGFISREKRLNRPHVQMLNDRLFVLRNRENCVPIAKAWSVQEFLAPEFVNLSPSGSPESTSPPRDRPYGERWHLSLASE